MKNASPIEHRVNGANNIPMSYSGPPTQDKIDRNKNR